MRRCGSSFKWLKVDLLLLGCENDDENAMLMEAFASFLIQLGKRLLPDAGSKPIDMLMRSRADVQELALLLTMVARRDER